MLPDCSSGQAVRNDDLLLSLSVRLRRELCRTLCRTLSRTLSRTLKQTAKDNASNRRLLLPSTRDRNDVPFIVIARHEAIRLIDRLPHSLWSFAMALCLSVLLSLLKPNPLP
jgi:hypothetical protein